MKFSANRKKFFRGAKIICVVVTAMFCLTAVFAAYINSLPKPDGFPILEYHVVSETVKSDGYDYTVPPADFAAQLDYLAAEGYTTITLLEFMKAKKGKFVLPEKPIVLTFDDGYKSNYDEMLPLLEARGMKAMLYMITNKIGEKDYLSWDELRDMQTRGIEIGSHTANHIPLTKLSPQKRSEEMLLSKLLLEWNGINTVFSFSYPNGACDESMPALLEANEYLTAVTGDAGLNDFSTNPYLLYRVNVPHPRFGIAEFRWRLFKAEFAAKIRNLFQH